MDLERIYASMPLVLQQAATSLQGWRLRRLRYTGGFRRMLEDYNARTFWDAERVESFRDQRLAAFVEHAARTVPYYRDLFRDLGADPRDIRTLEDLQKLPVLTKGELQAHLSRFVSEAVPGRGLLHLNTSGTTGAGLGFPATRDSHREQWAVWWRYRNWHGLDLGEPSMHFGGQVVVPANQRRPPYWRHNRAGRQLYFSSYHLNRETAPAYVEAMRRFGARWISGYPSLVAVMASHVLELGANLDIRWVTLGAESVLPQQVALIKQAFDVEALHHYGMAEMAANISLCPEGVLHVDEEFAAVEFLPAGEGLNRIVGTSMCNPAFPLLRYDVDDLAAHDGATCGCGRPGRVVTAIDGRKGDYIVTKTGVRVRTFNLFFKKIVNIREAQIYQSRVGHMTIRIVKRPEYCDRDEQHLRDEIARRMGDDIEFDIEYVDRLPRTKCGKLRLVVSSVPERELTSFKMA